MFLLYPDPYNLIISSPTFDTGTGTDPDPGKLYRFYGSGSTTPLMTRRPLIFQLLIKLKETSCFLKGYAVPVFALRTKIPYNKCCQNQ